jgi:hypothetical protein
MTGFRKALTSSVLKTSAFSYPTMKNDRGAVASTSCCSRTGWELNVTHTRRDRLVPA